MPWAMPGVGRKFDESPAHPGHGSRGTGCYARPGAEESRYGLVGGGMHWLQVAVHERLEPVCGGRWWRGQPVYPDNLGQQDVEQRVGESERVAVGSVAVGLEVGG